MIAPVKCKPRLWTLTCLIDRLDFVNPKISLSNLLCYNNDDSRINLYVTIILPLFRNGINLWLEFIVFVSLRCWILDFSWLGLRTSLGYGNWKSLTILVPSFWILRDSANILRTYGNINTYMFTFVWTDHLTTNVGKHLRDSASGYLLICCRLKS